VQARKLNQGEKRNEGVPSVVFLLLEQPRGMQGVTLFDYWILFACVCHYPSLLLSVSPCFDWPATEIKVCQ
jgi:hypothetical protein